MKLFIGIFLAVGLGLLTGAYYSYTSTENFLKTSIATTGTVVENRYERGSSSNSSGSYYGYIKFKSVDGNDVTFRSSVGTNPPSFDVGEEVKLNYDPKDPQNAKINTFFQLWFLALLLGGMGSVFTLIPLGILCFKVSRKKRDAWLRENGDRVSAKYLGVEIDSSLTVNGKNPYVIKSEWIDPVTNITHTFTSSHLWYNPEEHVKHLQLPVYVDRNNRSKYCVDLSMLPKAT